MSKLDIIVIDDIRSQIAVDKTNAEAVYSADWLHAGSSAPQSQICAAAPQRQTCPTAPSLLIEWYASEFTDELSNELMYANQAISQIEFSQSRAVTGDAHAQQIIIFAHPALPAPHEAILIIPGIDDEVASQNVEGAFLAELAQELAETMCAQSITLIHQQLELQQVQQAFTTETTVIAGTFLFT